MGLNNLFSCRVIQKQKELYKVELGTAIIEKYEEKDEKIFFIRENGIIIFEGNQITKNKLENYALFDL